MIDCLFKNLIHVIIVIVGVIASFVCVDDAIDVLEVTKQLENTFKSWQLYCKSVWVQTKFAFVKVMVMDIDVIIKDTHVLHVSQIEHMRYIIRLCDKLGIKLILTTKWRQNVAQRIGRVIFDEIYNVDIESCDNDWDYDSERHGRYIQTVNQMNHKFFTNSMDVEEISELLEFFGKICCVVFILHGVEDIQCLEDHSHDNIISVALGGDSSSDIEKEACVAICESTKRLKSILKVIDTATKIRHYLNNSYTHKGIPDPMRTD